MTKAAVKPATVVLNLDVETMREAIRCIRPFCNGPSRYPGMTGALLESMGGQLFLIGSDSVRMSVFNLTPRHWGGQPPVVRFVLPQSVINEMHAKLRMKHKRLRLEIDGDTVKVLVSSFAGEFEELIQGIEPGRFPDWQHLIPASFQHKAVLDGSPLYGVFHLMEAAGSGPQNSILDNGGCLLKFQGTQLTITASSSYGSAKSELLLKSGGNWETSLDAGKLLDFCRLLGEKPGDIELSQNDGDGIMMIEWKRLRHLVMPFRRD